MSIAIIRASKDPAEAKERLTAEVVVEKTALEKFLGVDVARDLGVRADTRTASCVSTPCRRRRSSTCASSASRASSARRSSAEYREVLALIADLKDVLAKSARVAAIIRAELLDVKERFGNPRRTEIQAEAGTLEMEDLIAEEEVVLTISRGGYAKRTPLSVYRAQRRGGKGRMGAATAAEDIVEHLFVGSTHDYLLAFTNKGRVHWVKVYDLPSLAPATRGKALVNFLALEEGERVAAIATTRTFPEDRFLLFATKRGLVKKTVLSAYGNPREKGIIAIKLEEGDELLSAQITDGARKVFLGTRNGMGIKFEETDVRPMGRDTTGVKGIELREGDVVVEMDLVEESGTLLAVTEKGYGKRTDVAEYREQGRGGTGVINVKVTEKNGPVVGVSSVTEVGPPPPHHGAGDPDPHRGLGRPRDGPRDDGRQAHRPRRGRPRRRRREALGRGRAERGGGASRGGAAAPEARRRAAGKPARLRRPCAFSSTPRTPTRPGASANGASWTESCSVPKPPRRPAGTRAGSSPSSPRSATAR